METRYRWDWWHIFPHVFSVERGVYAYSCLCLAIMSTHKTTLFLRVIICLLYLKMITEIFIKRTTYLCHILALRSHLYILKTFHLRYHSDLLDRFVGNEQNNSGYIKFEEQNRYLEKIVHLFYFLFLCSVY